MTSYPFHVQRDIVVACDRIRNFVLKKVGNYTFSEQLENDMAVDNGTSNKSDVATPMQEQERRSRLRASDQTLMINLRDQIANELYNSRTR